MQNNNSTKVTIDEVKKVVISNFPEYWPMTEACMATVATLLLKNNSNPTALVLIGEPSKGKTTVLELFEELEGIAYLTDQFTPKAFVSHYAKTSSEDLQKTDLLHRVIKKCLIVPDFGVIFGRRKEDLNESLGILTRVLDGKGLSSDSGVHGQRKVKGDCMFSMLCATTPFGYDIWDAMGRFGSRLLFIHMPEGKMSTEKLIDVFTVEPDYGSKKALCIEPMKQFFKELWVETGGFRSIEWDAKATPRDVLTDVINLAQVLSRLRVP